MIGIVNGISSVSESFLVSIPFNRNLSFIDNSSALTLQISLLLSDITLGENVDVA